MSKYRFKTKEEFIEDGNWVLSAEHPYNWNSTGEMNKYLGRDIDDDFISKIEKPGNNLFNIDKWSFKPSNCILKESVLDFKEGDTIEVVRTIIPSEDWNSIGEIPVTFKVGDIFTVKEIFHNKRGLRVSADYKWYPNSLFKKVSSISLKKKYTIKDFKKDQKVKVVSLEASEEDWNTIGKITVKLDIGQILTISSVSNGLYFKEDPNWCYPACLFEPCTESVLHTKEAHKEDLIAQAKKRYPIGTKFFPVHVRQFADFCIITNDSFKIEGDNIYALTDDNHFCSPDSKYGNTTFNRMVYEDGKWATVLSTDIPSPDPKSFPNKLIGKYVLSITSKDIKLPYGYIYPIFEEDKDFINCKDVGWLAKTRIKDGEILIFNTISECSDFLKTNSSKKTPLTSKDYWIDHPDLISDTILTIKDSSTNLYGGVSTKKRGITLIEPISIKKRLKF